MIRRLSIAGSLMSFAVLSHAGINSKEIGSVLFFPEYKATTPEEDPNATRTETYITITNARDHALRAHVAVLGGTSCRECGFDLELTGYQTRRLTLSRERRQGYWKTTVRDGSGHSETGDTPIITSCAEPMGFIVVVAEQAGILPPVTFGGNSLVGDAVVTDLNLVSSWQAGAIAIQGEGINDGNRELRFDNVEYSAFPSIVTANFWSPNESQDPRLVMFNVDFETGGLVPVTQCSLNYANAEEDLFSTSFSFGCWMDRPLRDIATVFEDDLGTANGFLWVKCDAGTHGMLVNRTEDGSMRSENADTMFQGMTQSRSAVLELTPFLGGAVAAPGATQ